MTFRKVSLAVAEPEHPVSDLRGSRVDAVRDAAGYPVIAGPRRL
ncbi:hypothetical protein ACWDV7_10805 [Streptomyces sp. NPDC003362]